MRNYPTCFCLAQGNPEGESQGDLPKLLRTFADTIENLGEIRVLDLVLATEDFNEYGMNPYFTLYFKKE